MSDQRTCPKCGAAFSSRYRNLLSYQCGSERYDGSELQRSRACRFRERIAELEASVVEKDREIARLQAKLAAADAMAKLAERVVRRLDYLETKKSVKEWDVSLPSEIQVALAAYRAEGGETK